MINKLLIIFLVYITANFLVGSLVKKENEWTYKQSYLQAADYPHEWYLIGSSRTRMGISSQLLSNELNQRVYNLSCSSFFMPSNWTQLESFLTSVSGKKLIVELAYNVTHIGYYPTATSRWEYIQNYYKSEKAVNNFALPYIKNIIENFLKPPFTAVDLIPGEFQKEKLQAQFDQWGDSKNPVLQLTHNPTQTVSLYKRSAELKSHYEKVIRTSQPNEYYLQKIQHLLAVARENHNEIYFYLPTTLSETEAEMLSSVWPYIPEANRIKTYEDPRFCQLMNEDVLFDEGHLNKKGSDLLTDIIVRQLRLDNVNSPLPPLITAVHPASPQK